MPRRPPFAAGLLLLAALAGAPAAAHAQAAGGDGKTADKGAAKPAAALPDSISRQLFQARTRGSATAPITVYEMSDFQCPFCRNFTLETYPALDERYVKTGKVRWIYINMPLTQLHKNAAAAAEFAMCAARQEKFWPVHDVLFRTQETWAPLKEPGAFLLSLADSAKLDRGRLLECLKSGAMQQEVAADAEGARRAGAARTPTFYVAAGDERGLLPGAPPLEKFTAILDTVLAGVGRRK